MLRMFIQTTKIMEKSLFQTKYLINNIMQFFIKNIKKPLDFLDEIINFARQ